MSLSDRVAVMYKGKIIGEVDPKQITTAEIGLLMAGAKAPAAPRNEVCT